MKRVVIGSGKAGRKDVGMEASAAFNVIMTVVNKRRPFEPSDFVKEYFIPDI